MLKRSIIRGQIKRVGDTDIFDADLQIAFDKLGLRETFTSHVITDATHHCVTATSFDGPMKALKAVWNILGTDDGKADVSITVDYTMKNKMLQMLVGGLTDFAAQKIMKAFEDRGKSLYGKALS